LLVEDVAGEQHLPAVVRADRVRRGEGERHTVGRGVEADGGLAEGVDVGAEHGSRTRLRRGDADQPGAGGEVEHSGAPHDLGMVENVAGEALAAGPGEGPVGRWQADLGQLLLGLQPEIVRLVGEMEADFGNVWRGDQRRVGEDEGFGAGGVEPAVRHQSGSTPPMRQTSRHSASVTGWTERRPSRTSAMSASFGLALISASVGGFGTSLTARMSTHSQRGSSVVESGCASLQTSTMPTMSSPSLEW